MIATRATSALTLKVLFWLAMATLAVIYLVDKKPLVVDAEQQVTLADDQHIYDDEASSDYAILVDPDVIGSRATEGQLDRSWVWLDVLRQELGAAHAIYPEDLTPERLANLRLLVVTESASSSPRVETQAQAIQAFVQGGGVAAFEVPGGRLREMFAGDGEGGWRIASTLSAIQGADELMAETLRAMPLYSRFLGNRNPIGDANTLLAMDGAPVAYSKRMGGGSVVIFDFRVATQLATIQQGKAGDRMRVEPRKSGARVHSSDLVADSMMMGSTVPVADEFEAWLVWHALGSTRPLIGLWPYPDGGRGALISSHTSRSLEGRPLWMSIHERDLGARSSTFVSAPRPDRLPDQIQDADMLGHAAMLWELDPRDSQLQREWGILGLHPVVQPLSLERQVEYLALGLKTVPRESIYGVRTAGGRWSEHFTGAFRAMQASGFRYSASYGPSGDTPPGYLFGTCQPFRPLDANGSPFALHEVPVCFVDPAEPRELELLGQSLRHAVDRAHALHVVTSADRFRTRPDLEQFDAWRDMLRFAGRNDMWIGGAGQLVEFWRQRAAARLQIVSESVEDRDETGAPLALRIVVEVETSRAGMALSIPMRSGAMELAEVSRGLSGGDTPSDDEQETVTEVMYRGVPMRVAPLSRGFSTYTLRYEAR